MHLGRAGVGFGLVLLQRVDDVGEGKERQPDAQDRQLGRPRAVLLRRRGRPPEPRPWVGIDRVVDLDLGHRLGRIRRDVQFGSVVAGGEDQLRVRRFRDGERLFEMLVEPQRPRDGELRGEAVVHVRGERVPHVLVWDQLAGAVRVVHDAVEVVRRTEPEQWSRDIGGVRLESQGLIEQLHVAVLCLWPVLRQKGPRLRPKPRPAN